LARKALKKFSSPEPTVRTVEDRERKRHVEKGEEKVAKGARNILNLVNEELTTRNRDELSEGRETETRRRGSPTFVSHER